MSITRSADDEVFAVSWSGAGTRPGVKAAELQRWLLALGARATVVDRALNLRPSESLTVEVPDTKNAGTAA